MNLLNPVRPVDVSYASSDNFKNARCVKTELSIWRRMYAGDHPASAAKHDHAWQVAMNSGTSLTTSRLSQSQQPIHHPLHGVQRPRTSSLRSLENHSQSRASARHGQHTSINALSSKSSRRSWAFVFYEWWGAIQRMTGAKTNCTLPTWPSEHNMDNNLYARSVKTSRRQHLLCARVSLRGKALDSFLGKPSASWARSRKGSLPESLRLASEASIF